MKNTIIAIALLLLCISGAKAQKYTSIDSVLLLIKNKPLFEALDRVEIKEEDREKLYYNLEFKNFLLKRLDQNLYFEYCIDKQIKEFKDLMKDKVFSDDELKSYLNGQKRGKQYDSIRKNTLVYKKYKDSIISDRIKLYRKGEDPKKYYPSTRWFMDFPYAEAHKIIKEWWIQEPDNGAVTINWTKKGFFDTLLLMNDPDAQELFSKKIDEFITTNGKSQHPAEIQSPLNNQNSYSLKQMFRLLTVTVDNRAFSDSPETPFNCSMMSMIIGTLEHEGGYKFPNISDEDYGSKKDCEDKFKFLPLAKKYSKEYYIKLNKEQEYWMKDMPFYKKKD
jgi:hypothetical protein